MPNSIYIAGSLRELLGCPEVTGIVLTSETRLVDSFERQLLAQACPWARHAHQREYDYRSGKTDLLLLTVGGELLAFEAKLRDWRRGLHQAWRNTSFVNGAYLLLPAALSYVAEKHGHLFREIGVGLCVLGDCHICVLIEHTRCQPLIGWLNERAKESLRSYGCGPSYRVRAARLRSQQLQDGGPVQCRRV